MKAHTMSDRVIVSYVLDSVISYCENAYTIIGYGESGIIWREREILDVKKALKRALTYVDSHKRLQNLLLFAPCLETLDEIRLLHTQGVCIDIYVGEQDKDARVILESSASFCTARYYKNVSFSDF